MSLTRFLKTYVYIPLGGNRHGKIRTYINVMIVYLISGIWHGANWTFILWGILHGFFNCLNRLFNKSWEKLGKVTQWFTTFMLVNTLWVLFRADSIHSAILFLKNMLCLSSFSIREELYKFFNLTEFITIENHIPFLNYLPPRITGLHMWLFILGAFFVVLNFRNSRGIEFKPTLTKSLTVIIFMFWSIISLAGVSTFLYFDF